MTMLQAYFDDSGTDGQSPYYVLAGYASTVDKWESFSDDWQDVLDGPPTIEYFKMREAYRQKDQFYGWGEDDAAKRATSFKSVIEKHAFGGFSVAIPQDLYNKYVSGNVPGLMDSPYFHCFFGSVEFLLRVIAGRMGRDVKVDFIFDTENLEHRIRPMFDDFKKWPWAHSGRMGNLDFRDDKEVLPLQAADMLAWRTRRTLANGGHLLPPTGEFSFPDDEKPPVLGKVFTETEIVRYMNRFQSALKSLTN